MKVNKAPDKFEPIVIELTSQDEVNALCTVVGSIVGEGSFSDTSIRSIANDLYKGLRDCGATGLQDLVKCDMGLGN